MFLLTLVLICLFLLLLVGTESVSTEHKNYCQAEEPKDTEGEEDDVALLPALGDGAVAGSDVGHVVGNFPQQVPRDRVDGDGLLAPSRDHLGL